MTMSWIPEGWSVTYQDPSLDDALWERKEDLLQLRHATLDRLIDLGWYQTEFAIFVFQGDFHGEQLAEFRTTEQATAFQALHGLLKAWGSAASA